MGALIVLLMIAEIFTRRRLGKVFTFTENELFVDHKDVVNFRTRLDFRPDRIVIKATWPFLRSGVQMRDSRTGQQFSVANAVPYYQRFSAGRQLALFFDAAFIAERVLTELEEQELARMRDEFETDSE